VYDNNNDDEVITEKQRNQLLISATVGFDSAVQCHLDGFVKEEEK